MSDARTAYPEPDLALLRAQGYLYPESLPLDQFKLAVNLCRGHETAEPEESVDSVATNTGVLRVLTATEALARGWSVIPVGLDKKPLIPTWKPFQSQRPTDANVADWMNRNPPAWAVITGAVSGIVTLDFDGPAGRDTMRRLGIEPHRQTGSGGYHADFQHPGWHVPTLNAKSKRELGARWPGLDIRADGGYVIFSGRNRSGQYTWLRDPEPYPLDILPADLREFLVEPPPVPRNGKPAAPVVNGRAGVETLLGCALDRVCSDGRNNAGFWLACQLRDNNYSQAEAESVMRSYESRVPGANTKGQHEPYTWDEATASLREAYGEPAREPWGSQTGDPAPSASGEPLPVPNVVRTPAALPRIRDGADLYDSHAEEIRTVIDNLLVDGLTLLAVRQKSGKSWLALQIAVAIAGGPQLHGITPRENGKVLWLKNLDFFHELLPLMGGGADQLKALLDASEPRLVVIDTLTALVKASSKKESDVFRSQYREIDTLRRILQDSRAAAILIHHTKKGIAIDAIDAVAGTGGITAAADSVWVLKRRPEAESILEVTGREIDEHLFALRFEREGPFGWRFLGDGAQCDESAERRELLNLLHEDGPLVPKQIASELNKNRPAVRQLLRRMVADGLVVKQGAKYAPSRARVTHCESQE